MFGRRASFWIAVGATAIVSQFALRLIADKAPDSGLGKFVDYINKGGQA